MVTKHVVGSQLISHLGIELKTDLIIPLRDPERWIINTFDWYSFHKGWLLLLLLLFGATDVVALLMWSGAFCHGGFRKAAVLSDKRWAFESTKSIRDLVSVAIGLLKRFSLLVLFCIGRDLAILWLFVATNVEENHLRCGFGNVFMSIWSSV